MTGWVSERMPHAALASSAPNPTVSALMPLQSQGAEKRSERGAGRTGSRWAMRALVIGGLAGVAWLLTGATAHAADHDATAQGSSLIGSVVNGDATPVLGNVLKAAAQPLDNGHREHAQKYRKHQHQGVTDTVLATPIRVLSRPVAALTGTLDEVAPAHGKNGASTALGVVDRVVRELSGPLRLTGGPADSSQLAPVATPLTRPLHSVVDALPQAAVPAGPQRPAPAEMPVRAAATRTADVSTAPHVEAPGPTAGHRDVVATTASEGRRHSIVTEGHPAAVSAARPDSLGGGTTPGGDGPAPLQVHLGALSGISTNASGAPTEGGSTAFLPAAVASGLVASHRLRKATDVEARRYDAEAPTVSPD